MEFGQIQCDNIGMTRDTDVSKLSKDQNGFTNYAFENHNIRILAANDNTKLAVTNEKSTKFETQIYGAFIGSCKLNKYVVIFTNDNNTLNPKPDYIYRLEFNGTNIVVNLLYNGDLKFNRNHPIEAVGYYESNEIQKVYWVDGLNQNRFINIADIEDANGNKVAPNYTSGNEFQFDFQGHIDYVPSVSIEKNYQKAGYFLAGTIQYFMTYYNKYGVETCIVWNSDLQYASFAERGAKADETISCGFDFKITNIDTDYDYLRIYSCYRSSINGVTEANIVTDISLEGRQPSDVITFTDLGFYKTAFNSQDLPYVGGQNIIANTLDYKQDTLFLGDIKLPENNIINTQFLKTEVVLQEVKDANGNPVHIQESNAISWAYKNITHEDAKGVYFHESQLRNSQEEVAGFKWREIYRFGIQFMTPTGEWTSAQWIGDKYCDIAPRTILKEGLYRLPNLTEKNTYDTITANGIVFERVSADSWQNSDYSITVYTNTAFPSINTQVYLDAACTKKYKDNNGNDVVVKTIGEECHMDLIPDANGIIHAINYAGITGVNFDVLYKNDGNYIAEAVVDFNALCTNVNDLKSKYIAYRLLVADMDVSNRRIIEQGVLCPTMFNYADRYYNRPYSIPSWIFRPRTNVGNTSAPTNRHYDSLPPQENPNAELQGIMEKLVPGFDLKSVDTDNYNAYMFVFGANDGGSYIKWKLIYYNAGNTDEEKVEKFIALADVDDKGHNKKTGVYGKDYKVVSSGCIKEVAGKWGEVCGGFLDKMTGDVIGNDQNVVLSPAMLPDQDQMKSIAYQKGSAAGILAIIGAVMIAVIAAVASIFTCGAAAAAGTAAIAAIASGVTAATITTTVSMSLLTVALAGAAIASGAGAAAIAKQMEHFKEIDRSMAAKGFLPINIEGHELKHRQKTPELINELFARYFTLQDGALIGDPDTPFSRTASTQGGALGMDYNAYVLGGPISFLSKEEEDLKNKSCLFCADESIVTMHTPTVEEHSYFIDNSEAYKLDLIGVVPVQAAHGEYDMQCTTGLNNSAQVIPNRFVDNPLYTSNINGLLNGNFYQDFNPDDKVLTENLREDRSGINPITVGATTALYRQWMWNRENTAGLWAPGLTLQSPIVGGEKLSTPAARINHKIFANLRYSENTQYYTPYEMSIETPVVCLDDQTMLKSFKFGDDVKFYYQNVNTISTYNKPYGLVVNGTKYPGTLGTEENPVDGIKLFNITDPVQIKYRNTPHILLPFKVTEGVTTILPYTKNEDPLSPIALYGESLKGIKLKGINPGLPKDEYEKLDYVYNEEPLSWQWHKGENSRGLSEIEVLDIIDTIELCQFISNGFRRTIYSVFKALDGVAQLAYNEVEAENYTEDFFRDDVEKALQYCPDIQTIAEATFSPSEKDKHKYLLCIDNKYFEVYNAPMKQKNGTYKSTWYAHRNMSSMTVEGIEGDYAEFVSYSKCVEREWGDGLIKQRTIKVNIGYYETKVEIEDTNTLLDYSESTTWYISNGKNTTYVKYPYEHIEDYKIDVYIDNTWNQVQLPWNAGKIPYLFMGELVKKAFDYDTWMGGYNTYGLQHITWNVASGVTPVGNIIKNTWGDTFYQRWDCEKTYPYTEEDKNSIVDVLSFMLESHNNLDGRCDINRGLNNLINLRPMNTIYNNVYSQKDNFFTYQLLDKKFEKNHFEADVLWSLTKANADDIDKWTCLLASNEMSLDGRYGAIRKILNVNDTLISFQDAAITGIKYNEQTAIATTAGLPLQMGNSGKVDGYRVLTDTSGCHNKFSISKNSAGVFYIDDYNKSFNQFSLNSGSTNLGIEAEFSRWFKDSRNLTGSIWTPNNRDGFRTSFDEVTRDLYIINKDICLVYNTLLHRFTSFMDYVDTSLITNINSVGGKASSFAFRNTTNLNRNVIEVYQLFAGIGYGNIYGQFRPYSIEYRLNPDPLHDSIFTNFVYSADWTDPNKEVDGENLFDSSARRYTTFDTVEAKNEYQHGITTLTTAKMGRHPVKAKFRIWRGDIPRDGYTLQGIKLKADRMRNPWIHLKFEKSKTDDSKMTFHNLMVTYYNQYGRY